MLTKTENKSIVNKLCDNRSQEESAVVQADINDLWEKAGSSQLIKGLESGRRIRSLLPDLLRAFARGDRSLGCSDDRLEISGKLGAAGQLILAAPEQVDAFVRTYFGRINRVVSHNDCGAGFTAWNRFKLAGQRIPFDAPDPDELAHRWSAGLAERLGCHHEIASISGRHQARILWVDGTGFFCPERLDGMPPFYLSSTAALGLPAAYLEDEIRVLAGVACGEHGYGQLIEPHHPFFILICAKDAHQYEAIERSARLAVNGDPKVVINGFTC